MDVGNDTTTRDGGLDEGVELLVTADSELKVAGSDTLDLEVLGGVASKLEHLSSEVLEDGSRVDGGGGTDTAVGRGAALQEAVDTADRELKAGTRRARLGVLLITSLLVRLTGGVRTGNSTRSRSRGGPWTVASNGVPCWSGVCDGYGTARVLAFLYSPARSCTARIK